MFSEGTFIQTGREVMSGREANEVIREIICTLVKHKMTLEKARIILDETLVTANELAVIRAFDEEQP
jgi:hypothetical protein